MELKDFGIHRDPEGFRLRIKTPRGEQDLKFYQEGFKQMPNELGYFRKKPVVIRAAQWMRNGDHPEDDCHDVPTPEGTIKSEGKIVRYFRRPDVPGDKVCECLLPMHVHGWIDTLEGGHIVCPGDWIITGIKGERYPCKPDIFEATYERVEP